MEEVNGIDNLNNFIIENQDKNIILFFGTDWCGPCKKLKNKIIEIQDLINNKNCILCYIDADNDDNLKITEKYIIKFLPTQIFINLQNIDNYLKVNIINRIDGYDWTKIQQILSEL